MLFKKLSIPCHHIIYFSLLLQEGQRCFFRQSAQICPWMLFPQCSETALERRTLLLALKKCLIPFRADMHTLRQAPAKLFCKPNNTEAFISDIPPQQSLEFVLVYGAQGPKAGIRIIPVRFHTSFYNPGHDLWTEELKDSNRQRWGRSK